MQRSLVQRVAKAFENAQLELGLLDASEQAEVATLREAFLSAGVRALQHQYEREDWLQFGLSVRQISDPTSERELFAALAPLVRALLLEGAIDRGFYMFKPPGMRLRIRGKNLRQDVIPRVRDALQEHTENIAEIGPYDPEVYQFGGQDGLDVAHEYFTTDSLASLEFFSQETCSVEPMILSLLILSDLFRKVAGDTWEQWDLWAHLKLTGRLISEQVAKVCKLDEEFTENEPLYRTIYSEPAAVMEQLNAAERGIVDMLFAANTRAASRLHELAAHDRILFGPRKVVPFWAIFHWNRWGIDVDDQSAMAYSMERLLNPKGTIG